MPLETHNLRGTYSELEIDSDDLSVYIARWPHMLGEVHLDYFGRTYRRSIELFCKDGTVTADFGAGTLTLADGTVQNYAEPVNERYVREMRHFLGVLDGRCASANTPQTALNVLKLTLGGECVTMERVLITICGRAGSKGFKNKNLKIFDGLPLSHYSLAAAQLFMRQNPELHVDVCLNTDSELLVDAVTSKYPGGDRRAPPEELCGDVVPKMRVFQHSLCEMEKKNGCEYAYLIDLDITSPLRREGDVTGAYETAKAHPEWDLVFSVCRRAARRT